MTSPTWRPTGPVAAMAAQCSAASRRGVAVAAAPVAARHGAAALERGGTALDAAVTAALCETVLLPPKCGLAGDLVALVWEPGADQPEALLAIGGAPSGLADVARRGELDATGANSVGVPGAPSGYLALADRATADLAELAAPAIGLARNGFTWSTICSVLALESLDLVAAHGPLKAPYFPDGRPIEPNSDVRLPGLARALQHLVDDREQYLTGAVGRAIVDRVSAAGGTLTLDDMRFGRAQWCEPASLDSADGVQFATPAPTHGPSLLDAIGRLGANTSPAAVYRAVGAAIEARDLSLTDPSGTSMVSAVDSDGRQVAIIHSNSFPRFGSGLIVDEFDLVLANRAGRGFSSDLASPNFPAPGRRPATTLHAWGWSTSDGRRVLGATPGGANQMPWNAQSIARLLGSGVDRQAIGEAIIAPRWQLDPDGGVTCEDGFAPDELADMLSAVGESSAASEVGDGSLAETDHAEPLRAVDRWALRSAMQITVVDGDERFAAVDPRTIGSVAPVS